MEQVFRGEHVLLQRITVGRARDNLTVCRLGLDRAPVRNALNRSMLSELEHALLCPAVVECGVLVLHSTSSDFCLGVDLTELAAESDAEQMSHLVGIERVLTLIGDLPGITMALVGGRAFGAGADVAVACDYRVGFSGPRIAFRGWRFGLALGTRRLVDRVGASTAMELLVSGRSVEAEAAKGYGLLTHLAADSDEADRLVEEVCDSLLEIPAPARRQLVELTRPPTRTQGSHDTIASIRADSLAENLARFRAGLRRQTNGSGSK